MKLREPLMATLLVASPFAQAQSSVVLYGRLDAGLQYINHVPTGNGSTANSWSAEGGDWGTSMLGFKGTEDLGGGLHAIFTLETGLQVQNGTTSGGLLFSRRAFAGLKSDEWGTLQAGRNLFIDSDGVWEFDPMAADQQQRRISQPRVWRFRRTRPVRPR
jgi:predicted porin